MTKIVDGLLYTQDDEWVAVVGDEATLGISDYAQDSLSDIVYVELPNIGTQFNAGDTFGVVESVKAAADLFSPISGRVIAVNEALPGSPELINSDPYEAAWLIKVKMSNPDELNGLMTATAYRTYCQERQ